MRFVNSNSIQIATEAFGEPSHPALVMVMGATASMLGWPDELCVSLADAGLFVIRFDHRDTGQSTAVPLGEADYVVEDMAGDIVAILDAYGVQSAHLAGMSLGGYISQMAALKWPDCILSLTLIGSEPLGWDGRPLPQISQEFLTHFGALGDLDWSDREAVILFLVQGERLCANNAAAFDDENARVQIGRVLSRAQSPASMFNHGALTVREDWTGRFREIKCGTLVVHGEQDPILPVENGRALAGGIEGSEFLLLPGVGHELPPQVFPAIVSGIAELVARSSN